MEFSDKDLVLENPKKRSKTKKKRTSPKKRKRLAQRETAAKRRALGRKAKSKARSADQPCLDSVFLFWFTSKEEDIKKLGYDVLQVPFETEIARFADMERISRSLREQLRSALLRVLEDRKLKEKANDLTSGKAIRDWWIDIIANNLDILGGAAHGLHAEDIPPRSITGAFIQSLASKSSVYPPGDSTRSSSTEEGSTDDHSDTTSDGEFEVRPDENSGNEHEASADHDGQRKKPLVFDSEARAAVKNIKQAKEPTDINDRTASFISDRFMGGSSYINDMLSGNTPWPKFSRKEFLTNCRTMATLYDNVRMREELGKELSEKARNRLLKSEFDTITNIRTSLHIARLGPGGGKEYRDRVTTEASRDDFAATFTDPKAFKWFMRSLAHVKSARPASRNASSSSSFRGGTGPFRAPRRSRSSRGRRGARRGRPSFGRPSSSSRGGYSSRGGFSGRRAYSSSRFRASQGNSRRYSSAPKGRRRQRF